MDNWKNNGQEDFCSEQGPPSAPVVGHWMMSLPVSSGCALQ